MKVILIDEFMIFCLYHETSEKYENMKIKDHNSSKISKYTQYYRISRQKKILDV
jgi:hypothetical protein